VPKNPPKAASRADEILDIASHILVDEGYAALTFRSVAKRGQIGLGNLQHYFPTKTDLIGSMLARSFDRFSAAMAASSAGRGGSSPAQKLDAAIQYILEDQRRKESCIIFWELWALASHAESAARIMTKFYDLYVENIAALIAGVRPSVSLERARLAGTQIAALLEGASLFRGHGRPRKRHHAALGPALTRTVYAIIENA